MDLLDILAEIDGGHRMEDLGGVAFPDNLAHYRALHLHTYRCTACDYRCDGMDNARRHEMKEPR